jgi:restriction system protein
MTAKALAKQFLRAKPADITEILENPLHLGSRTSRKTKKNVHLLISKKRLIEPCRPPESSTLKELWPFGTSRHAGNPNKLAIWNSSSYSRGHGRARLSNFHAAGSASCWRESSPRPVHEVPSRSDGQRISLTEKDLAEMLPSGVSTTLGSRVGWACTYLVKAGLLHRPRRGHLQITPLGLKIPASKPKKIDNELLEQFPDFVSFQNKKSPRERTDQPTASSTTQTPQEQIEAGYRQIRTALASEMLEKLKQTTPAFFERVVVELLVRMGYGGSLKDAGKAIGKSGDEGIDGIIKEDKLGLDAIYIQAKRWTDKPVGRPEIQQFAGALSGQGAHKGIFITTSTFTADAKAFVSKVNHKIVLIDGDELTELMIDYGIGVITSVNYELKRIDAEYFEGE